MAKEGEPYLASKNNFLFSLLFCQKKIKMESTLVRPQIYDDLCTYLEQPQLFLPPTKEHYFGQQQDSWSCMDKVGNCMLQIVDADFLLLFVYTHSNFFFLWNYKTGVLIFGSELLFCYFLPQFAAG